MTGLEHALNGLRQALDAPRRQHMWRWLVRHRMSAVKDALIHEHTRATEAWLAPREGALDRERARLVGELATLGPQVLEAPDVEPVRRRLQRLLVDVEHHRRRLTDLAYDSVSLELGGEQ